MDDRAWPCQAVIVLHDKPQENPMHLLAKNNGAGLGTCCATPSPKLQSTGTQRESGSVDIRRQPGKEQQKRNGRRWTTAGAPSTGWPVIERGGGASSVPCTPAGVTSSDEWMNVPLTSSKAHHLHRLLIPVEHPKTDHLDDRPSLFQHSFFWTFLFVFP